SADVVIAQVNPRMPRSHGDGLVHASRFAAAVEVDAELPAHEPTAPGPIELAIGRHCAALIDNGSTLQMGIGAIPDAVLASLQNHTNLGVHTEMFSDGVLRLVESGV